MADKTVFETLETQAHRIIIKGDGILRVYSKPSHIEYGDVKALLDKFAEIRNSDERLIVLMDPTEENSMTNEARKLIINHMQDQVECLVVISRKKFVRVLFGIFSAVKELGVNMKMVSKEEEGELWIKSQYPDRIKS